jgi:hypothetical protein
LLNLEKEIFGIEFIKKAPEERKKWLRDFFREKFQQYSPYSWTFSAVWNFFCK